jgi:hypothetical protein
VFSSVGNVLRDFGQEIQRSEHLEIARRAGGQFPVARFGEAPERVVLGLVDPSPGTLAQMSGQRPLSLCPVRVLL